MPLGPTGFKGHFFDGDWLNSNYFCFSLCYVLYAIFINFVDKTTVNAQPLRSPIFEKIAANFKNNVSYYFGYLRLRFFFVFLTLSIFGCPFPPGPDWFIFDRGRCHFRSILEEVVERRRSKRQDDATLRQNVPKASMDCCLSLAHFVSFMLPVFVSILQSFGARRLAVYRRNDERTKGLGGETTKRI